MTNRMLKETAIAAIESEFGFAPIQKQVVLLEASEDRTYILFKVGKHTYKFSSYLFPDGSVWVGDGTLEIIDYIY